MGEGPSQPTAEELLAAALEEGHVDIEELARRHPEQAHELRRLHASLREVEGLFVVDAGHQQPDPRTARLSSSERVESSASPAPQRPAWSAHASWQARGAAQGQVGPYVIRHELGSGGQGTVYLADDTRLERRVALKLLSGLASETTRQRFRREAEVIARIEHDSLASVLDADLEADVPWIAMPFVEGHSLLELIREAREEHKSPGVQPRALQSESTEAATSRIAPLAMPPHTRAELANVLTFFETIARALAVAHAEGVIHRDVKPGNLMVTADGRPIVLDFGLATAREGAQQELTLSGEVFGTPAYMTPEQWEARPTGPPADVYSLGVTLYEALTLERPYRGDSQAELRSAVLAAGAADPRDLNGAIPRDLSIVVAKAIAREPERRYASASAFADDLRRVRNHEPIAARPASVALKLRRWARRQPVVASALVTTFLALAVGLAVSLSLLAQKQEALRRAFGAPAAIRVGELKHSDEAAALALALEAYQLAEHERTRSAVLEALEACQLESILDPGDEVMTRQLALDDSGAYAGIVYDVVESGNDSALSAALWNLERGEVVLELPRGGGAAGRREFVVCAGVGRLAFAGNDQLELWSVKRGLQERVTTNGDRIRALQVSPHPKRQLAIASESGKVRMYDRELNPICEFESAGSVIDRIEFGLEGQRCLLYASDGSTRARLFELPAGVERPLPTGVAESISHASLAAQGTATLVVLNDGQLVELDSTDGSQRRWLAQLDTEVRALLVDESGERAWLGGAGPTGARSPSARSTGEAAAAGWLAKLELTDAKPQLARVEGLSEVVRGLAYSPRCGYLASMSDDGTRVWNAASMKPREELRATLRAASGVWSQHGHRLVTRTRGSALVHSWCIDRPGCQQLRQHGPDLLWLDFAPDGRRLFALQVDGQLNAWHTPHSEQLRTGTRVAGALVASKAAHVRPLGARRSDAMLVTWGATDGSALWAMDGDEQLVPRSRLAAGAAIVDADYRLGLHAALTEGGELHWAADAQTARRAQVDGARRYVRVSPDRERIACAGHGHELLLLDAETGQVNSNPSLTGSDSAREVAVRALEWCAETRLVALCNDQRVRVVDTESGDVRSHRTGFRPVGMQLARDGKRVLVWGDRYGPLRVIDLESGAWGSPLRTHGARIDSACFAYGGRFVVTGGRDRRAIVWELEEPLTQRGGSQFLARKHASAVLMLAAPQQAGDLRVASVTADGSIRIWPVDPLPQATQAAPRELERFERRREQDLENLPR